MKLARDIPLALLFLAWPSAAQSPTIREVDHFTHHSDVFTIPRHDYELDVFCDSPRGNVVYVVVPDGGVSWTPGVAALHQPEMCK